MICLKSVVILAIILAICSVLFREKLNLDNDSLSIIIIVTIILVIIVPNNTNTSEHFSDSYITVNPKHKILKKITNPHNKVQKRVPAHAEKILVKVLQKEQSHSESEHLRIPVSPMGHSRSESEHLRIPVSPMGHSHSESEHLKMPVTAETTRPPQYVPNAPIPKAVASPLSPAVVPIMAPIISPMQNKQHLSISEESHNVNKSAEAIAISNLTKRIHHLKEQNTNLTNSLQSCNKSLNSLD